jgi:hypothetical protein
MDLLNEHNEYWTLYINKKLDPHTSHLINSIYDIKSGEHIIEYDDDGASNVNTDIKNNLIKHNVPIDISNIIIEYVNLNIKCLECEECLEKYTYLPVIDMYWYEKHYPWTYHKKTNQLRCYDTDSTGSTLS